MNDLSNTAVRVACDVGGTFTCELTHLQQQYYVAMGVQVPEEQNID